MPAWESPEPAYFTVPVAETPDRIERPDPLHGVWATVPLLAAVVRAVHAGSGVPEVEADELVAGIARRPLRPTIGGVPESEPVVPGSSWKGALRVVFEAMTPSCDPLRSGSCTRSDTGGIDACPACTVFGFAGVRGLVTFTDLVPSDGTAPEVVIRVAQRYSHKDAPRHGIRLYGLEPEGSSGGATETLVALSPGTALRGEIGLRGCTKADAGMLTIALGLGPHGLPLFRLGGGKNRGLGAARFEIDGEAGGQVADSFVDWAGRSRQPLSDAVLEEWQRAALDEYQADATIATIRREYSEPGP